MLRQRIQGALDEKFSVLALADGRTGTPPLASRFRLESFQAAVETGNSVIPAAIRCTSGRSNHQQTRITLGTRIHGRANEIAPLRDRIRLAIYKLYD